MADPALTTASNRPTEIFPGNLPLDAKIKERILRLAGREATATYQIASGHATENAKPCVQRPLFSEPFTYADWHNVIEDECIGEKGFLNLKRKLLQERGRSFKKDGRWNTRPPCPRNRWSDFTKALEGDEEKKGLVKRIALPHQVRDLEWVSKNLTGLEELDLGALREVGDWGEHGQFKEEERDWNMILSDSKCVARKYLGSEDVKLFTCFLEGSARKEELSRRLADIEAARKAAWALSNDDKKGLQHSRENEDLDPEFQELENKNPRTMLASAEAAYQELLQQTITTQRAYDIWHAKDHHEYSPPQELVNLMTSLETTLFTNLTWLGIRDWRGDPYNVTATTEQKIIDVVLPQCRNLKTLSIRGEYTADPHIDLNTYNRQKSESFGCAHNIVCDFILRLADRIPDTVTTLELRLSLSFLSYFLEKLHELVPSIQRVGIDLGAWVQIYPLRTTSGHECCEFRKTFTEEDVKNTADVAALQARFDAYKTAHNEFRADGQINPTTEAGSWVLPPLNQASLPYETSDDEFSWVKDSPERRLTKFTEKMKERSFRKDEARNGRADQKNKWDAPSVEDCTLDKSEHVVTAKSLNEEKARTLPQMLKKLYSCRHKDEGGSQSIRLFALEPESWERSLNPVHPLALLQTVDEADSDAEKTYRGVNTEDDIGEVYKWLEQAFHWRPVFDWDWFMVPDNMKNTVDTAYTKLFGTEYCAATEVVVKRIRTHFSLLKEAGIPVHLLIGRRSEEKSSCYWGWPYDEKKWQYWLGRDFDANLLNIAPLVDTLSIFYDLRNPLDEDKLEEIDALSPHIRPSATCPSVLCPWREDNVCPFHIQREPQGHANRKSPTKQKMANKQVLKPKKPQGQPKGYDRLANGSLSAPPVGENANDHPSDDSDSEDAAVEHANPHHLARRAVYTREAVGWQRFWATYALLFTSLSCLRIRMPRSFDKIGSWRLAKLLDQRQGWQISVYTDERQHIQTAEDILTTLPGGFEHEAEEKVWPAGRFVRRTWVWPQVDVQWKPPASREQKANLIREFDDLFGDIGEEAEGPPSPPTVIDKLELVTTPHPAWKNRVFTNKDWEDTRAHEAQEFLKAKATASMSQEALSSYYSLPSSVSKLNDFYQAKQRGVMKMRKIGRQAWIKALHHYHLTFENALEKQGLRGKNHPLETAAEKLYALLNARVDALIWKEGAEGKELKDFRGVRKRLLDQEESERARFGAGREEETREAVMDSNALDPRLVLVPGGSWVEESLAPEPESEPEIETTSAPEPVHETRSSKDNGKRKATSAPESEGSQPTKKVKETTPQLEPEPEPEYTPLPESEPEIAAPVAEPDEKIEEEKVETIEPKPKPKNSVKEKKPPKPKAPKASKAPKALKAPRATKPKPKASTPDPDLELELELEASPPSVHSDSEPKSAGAQEWTDKPKKGRPAKGGKSGAKGGKGKVAEKKTEPKKGKVVKEKKEKKTAAPKKVKKKKEEEIQSPVSRRLRSRK
jgi:hypothetical protein